MSSLSPGRHVTIHDVAARAGVSQPTASLVLSNHPRARVAVGARQRVLNAATALGYRPNVVARALSQRRSFALGIMVPDIRNPFVADVVTGAEGVAADAGYAVRRCDDIELARNVTPELTTISEPARERGARTARLLLQRIERSTQRVPTSRPLPVRLVARASSGRVPSSNA